MITARVHRPRVTAFGVIVGSVALWMAYRFVRSLELRDTTAIIVASIALFVLVGLPFAYFIGNARAVIPVRVSAEGLRMEGHVFGEPKRRVWAWEDVSRVVFHEATWSDAGAVNAGLSIYHRSRGRLVVLPTTEEGLGRLTSQMVKAGVSIRRE